ncbi:NAD(P)-dependent oxidoreductase [Novosphingobium sp. M1R2S20]|uniref:NAD(P)-dependent oxidoreductase n=1 Tax=Novosphingobium rhizovicinum TaxID=3228928 RepID=A0ABV3R7I9_9SPHN
MNRVGFIGLGSQGGPMAERILAAGYPLTVWARRSEVAEDLAAKGADVAGSIAELGADCDHVGVCVVNDDDVASVCEQLIPAMRSGSLIVIHSTVLPETCQGLARRCAAHGIDLIDAPVSGGGAGAAAGTLTVMCGGAADAFAAARPVLDTFAELVVLLGEVGAGQRAKIVNNALLAANMGLAQAALQAGDALDLDRGALADLIKASSGRSFGFEVFARLPHPRDFAVGAPLLVKDVGLLKTTLPDDAGAEALRAAADPFLSAATGGPDATEYRP